MHPTHGCKTQDLRVTPIVTKDTGDARCCSAGGQWQTDATQRLKSDSAKRGHSASRAVGRQPQGNEGSARGAAELLAEVLDFVEELHDEL